MWNQPPRMASAVASGRPSSPSSRCGRGSRSRRPRPPAARAVVVDHLHLDAPHGAADRAGLALLWRLTSSPARGSDAGSGRRALSACPDRRLAWWSNAKLDRVSVTARPMSGNTFGKLLLRDDVRREPRSGDRRRRRRLPARAGALAPRTSSRNSTGATRHVAPRHAAAARPTRSRSSPACYEGRTTGTPIGC